MSHQGSPGNQTGVLIRGGNLDTLDSRAVCTQRKDLVRSQQEGDHLQAKERNLTQLGIPGMVEPGELPSMGSHRVGHD